MNDLRRAAVGRTTIIIAHRLSTVRHADRIVVLSEGRVVEEGEHEGLLGIEGGKYRELWELQSQDGGEGEEEGEEEGGERGN